MAAKDYEGLEPDRLLGIYASQAGGFLAGVPDYRQELDESRGKIMRMSTAVWIVVGFTVEVSARVVSAAYFRQVEVLKRAANDARAEATAKRVSKDAGKVLGKVLRAANFLSDLKFQAEIEDRIAEVAERWAKVAVAQQLGRKEKRPHPRRVKNVRVRLNDPDLPPPPPTKKGEARQAKRFAAMDRSYARKRIIEEADRRDREQQAAEKKRRDRVGFNWLFDLLGK